MRSGKIFTGKSVHLKKGCWQELSFRIPSWEGALIGEMGVCFDLLMGTQATQTFAGLLDDLWADGTPDYLFGAALTVISLFYFRSKVAPHFHRHKLR